jgi:hypothetical protein
LPAAAPFAEDSAEAPVATESSGAAVAMQDNNKMDANRRTEIRPAVRAHFITSAVPLTTDKNTQKNHLFMTITRVTKFNAI